MALGGASCAGACVERSGEGFQSWKVEWMLSVNKPEPFSASLERGRAERLIDHGMMDLEHP